MSSVNLSYVDSVLGYTELGDQLPLWRHLHWGLFDDPEVADDSPARYFAAAEAMTAHLVASAGVADGARVLDVGCGFGGTLDLIRTRYDGCRLAGVNIDERQIQAARRLLGAGTGEPPAERAADRAGVPAGELPVDAAGGSGGRLDGGPISFAAGDRAGAAVGGPISFVAGDGCRLPVADGSVDHVLAVECLFHFPSRKRFFKEAARVLRPGGTVALTDFVAAPGSVGRVLKVQMVARAPHRPGAGPPSPAGAAGGDPAPRSLTDVVARKMDEIGFSDDGWYGFSSRPLTAAGYTRVAQASGFEPLVDDDVTARTLPTYAALNRLHDEAEALAGGAGDDPSGALAVAANEGMERLMLSGDLEYRVMSFRRRDPGAGAAAPRAGG